MPLYSSATRSPWIALLHDQYRDRRQIPTEQTLRQVFLSVHLGTKVSQSILVYLRSQEAWRQLFCRACHLAASLVRRYSSQFDPRQTMATILPKSLTFGYLCISRKLIDCAGKDHSLAGWLAIGRC